MAQLRHKPDTSLLLLFVNGAEGYHSGLIV
jgi:hypothetical protein